MLFAQNGMLWSIDSTRRTDARKSGVGQTFTFRALNERQL
jgi:hypothetical protein